MSYCPLIYFMAKISLASLLQEFSTLSPEAFNQYLTAYVLAQMNQKSTLEEDKPLDPQKEKSLFTLDGVPAEEASKLLEKLQELALETSKMTSKKETEPDPVYPDDSGNAVYHVESIAPALKDKEKSRIPGEWNMLEGHNQPKPAKSTGPKPYYVKFVGENKTPYVLCQVNWSATQLHIQIPLKKNSIAGIVCNRPWGLVFDIQGHFADISTPKNVASLNGSHTLYALVGLRILVLASGEIAMVDASKISTPPILADTIFTSDALRDILEKIIQHAKNIQYTKENILP